MKPEKLSDAALLMRLEVARLVNQQPVWFLLDWLYYDREITREMMRILERFNRIAISLARQREGRKARNEPYADAIGVRVKMGPRIIGVWPRGPHETQLLTARTASASEHIIESNFATWHAGRAQSSREAGTHSTPPPCRASRSESNANKEE